MWGYIKSNNIVLLADLFKFERIMALMAIKN
jgi:hypothetical protein